MQMTKQIQESGADDEAYSEFMREYNSNRHRKWFRENRTNDLVLVRDQILLSSLSSTKLNSEESIEV